VRIRDPLENSMAIFKFPSPVLPEGTTFVFGSWVCVANGAGGFRRHIVDDTIKLKTLPERLDNFVDNLGELPFFDSAMETEAESVTTVPFSTLEKDLDFLLQAGGSEATACRGAEDHLATCGLMITTTSEGRIVHWRGMNLSDLLGHEDRLVAHLEPLPFQDGRALATITEGSTELVEAPSEELATRQLLMAEEGDNDALIPIGALDGISEDEETAEAVDENDAERDARCARNRARAVRRRRANERIRFAQRELDAEFAAADERGFRTPVANIARVTALLERSNDPNDKRSVTPNGHGSSWTSRPRHHSSGTSALETAGARPQVEQQAIAHDPNAAIKMMVWAGVSSPAEGDSYLRQTTRGSLTLHVNNQTFARRSMRGATPGQSSTRGDGNAR
jgi:hypothetical protein